MTVAPLVSVAVITRNRVDLLPRTLPTVLEQTPPRPGHGTMKTTSRATNFGKNRMGNPADGGPSSNYAEGDKPEFVAGLVLQAIEEGQAQYFANDHLRKMAGVAA